MFKRKLFVAVLAMAFLASVSCSKKNVGCPTFSHANQGQELVALK